MTQPTPFKTLLIANRGEIAARIIRTARQMGLTTVAVYSTADADAEHVRLADRAVCIGEAAPAASYLRVDAILQAARQAGADAIHPGYGFLSENPEFALACEQAGIVFVGPSAQAIRDMGDKAAAKTLMEQAGVPCVPGYQGQDQSAGTLRAQADRISYPLMIKATAGGGGRGMRLVAHAQEFDAALSAAKSEAMTAFGNDVVLLEKAIPDPRHVEIQIMADGHGNVIHCGERDCSVQRRHQKLIEEAPSPAVTPDIRRRMGEASVQAARAIGYVGAGTFEYLLDATGNFYFMEMNTRLQVEHPVTEAITRLDLVELQLRVAAGQPLPLTQDDVQLTGHAIEVRLCAEDPQAGFMPQSGRMALWHPSGGLRVDHALRSGAEVPPYYDSMVAKLIAHGTTRDEALSKLQAGLQDTVALGLRTNKAFLSDCLSHPVFAAGGATTGFVDAHASALLQADRDAEPQVAMIAAALMRAGPGNRLTHRYFAPLHLATDQAEYHPRVQALADGLCHVEMEGQPPLDLRVIAQANGERCLELQGVRQTVQFVADAARIHLQIGGRCYDFRDLTFAPAVSAAQAGGDGKVRALMNGNVVTVQVAVGDVVQAGQPLLVLEAMKMEHAHTSAVSGIVQAVHAREGMQVSTHAILIEVDPAE